MFRLAVLASRPCLRQLRRPSSRETKGEHVRVVLGTAIDAGPRVSYRGSANGKKETQRRAKMMPFTLDSPVGLFRRVGTNTWGAREPLCDR